MSKYILQRENYFLPITKMLIRLTDIRHGDFKNSFTHSTRYYISTLQRHLEDFHR